jgi:hypothetical protein
LGLIVSACFLVLRCSGWGLQPRQEQAPRGCMRGYIWETRAAD